MQEVKFPNSKGDMLAGIISLPEKSKQEQIVIIVHGFSSSKSGSAQQIAEELEKADINSLKIDLFGHGDSEGDFPDITISEGGDDVLSAIKFLQNEGYKNISLIGTSFGGTSSIVAASQTDALQKLVLRCPVADYFTRDLMTKSRKELEDWRDKGYRIYTSGDGRKLKVKYKFVEDMKTHHGFLLGEKIKVPTLIIHGDQDESVPVIQSEMLAKVIPDCKLIIIEGADHDQSKPKHQRQVLDAIVEFLS